MNVKDKIMLSREVTTSAILRSSTLRGRQRGTYLSNRRVQAWFMTLHSRVLEMKFESKLNRHVNKEN